MFACGADKIKLSNELQTGRIGFPGVHNQELEAKAEEDKENKEDNQNLVLILSS
jgi:hypothetical protein